MFRLTASTILLLVFSTVGQSQAVNDPKALLVNTHRQLMYAMMHSDTAVLNQLLAKECVIVDTLGINRRKNEVIEGHKVIEAESKTQRANSVTLSDTNVRVYGKSAVVTGLLNAREPDVNPARYLCLYIWRSGGWRMVAMQSTFVGLK